MLLPSITNLVQICAAQGVSQVILSPGSRCAPLTLAFVRHPDIQVRTVSDERSAAFISLGMAQRMRKPVGLVCTSGSAAYNYAPAIAESFFQQIPLLIFTADRPPEWIDQLDGQTIRQRDIYGRHVKASYELPVGQTKADVHYAGRMGSEAINLSRTYPCGPVHINVPVREPFYPAAGEEMVFDKSVKVIEQVSGEQQLSSSQIKTLREAWQSYSRKLLVCGQQRYDILLTETLQALSTTQQIPVVADIIANQHEVEGAVRHADVLLAKQEELFQQLQPDLLVTFGLSVISKNLKLFLRKHSPKAHWHVQPTGVAADTFLSLTRVVHSQPVHFFQAMRNLSVQSAGQADFYQSWQQQERKAVDSLEKFFAPEKNYPPGEFEAVQLALQHLPADVDLHLANSMAVRYANLAGLKTPSVRTQVFANRGTSGIDGSNSTAVGSALASGRLTVLLTGDMAFFYDRNAFWHNYPLPNLRIILLNNHGGGIFRIIEGPGRQPELDEYFETQQRLQAENTAQDFGMAYQRIDFTQEKNTDKLKQALPGFYKEPAHSVKILEIITDSRVNTQLFNQYKMLINQNNEA